MSIALHEVHVNTKGVQTNIHLQSQRWKISASTAQRLLNEISQSYWNILAKTKQTIDQWWDVENTISLEMQNLLEKCWVDKDLMKCLLDTPAASNAIN